MTRKVHSVANGEGAQDARFMASEVPVLDPARTQAAIDERGQLKVRLPDGSEHLNVRVVPAFPITRLHRLLYLFDGEGRELGLLVEPKRLDQESRSLLLAQADQAYFMPRILRIVSVDERTGSGIAHWEVETDRGRISFDVVSRSESVWYMGQHRVVIRDAHGNRYLIEDQSTLDRRSRALADLYL